MHAVRYGTYLNTEQNRNSTTWNCTVWVCTSISFTANLYSDIIKQTIVYRMWCVWHICFGVYVAGIVYNTHYTHLSTCTAIKYIRLDWIEMVYSPLSAQTQWLKLYNCRPQWDYIHESFCKWARETTLWCLTRATVYGKDETYAHQHRHDVDGAIV